MPAAFSEAERADITQKLKEAGRRLFTSAGLKKTSLADLTGHAGIVKSTFYSFFDSKEALYLELLLERVAETRRHTVTEGMDKGQDTPDALRRFLHGAVRVLDTDPLYRRLTSHPEEIAMMHRRLPAARMAPLGDNGMAELTNFITDRQSDGALPGNDPVVVAGAIRAVLLLPVHAAEFGEHYTAVRDLVIDSLVTGLTAPPITGARAL